MSTKIRLRALFALFAVAVLSAGIAACGGDDETTTTDGGGLIQSNPDNSGVEITVGSKNFTEEYILAEIYAQGLEAAGYDVKTDLNVGDSPIAVKALKAGEIDAYPDYTSTVLEGFFGIEPQDVPADTQAAYEQAKAEFEKEGLTAFPPTPFADANAVGTLTSTANKLGLENVSDLEGKSQDLTLYGSPECRQRTDCLLGLQDNYGLEFKSFTPVDIALRYEVLDKGQADLSILFTSDAQLFANPDKYTILNDDKGIFPAGNVLFIARQETVDEAGPDLGTVVEQVQQNLSLEVIQELNARVDIDKEEPAVVAHDYLKSSGLVE